MASRLTEVIVDCHDLEALADFWCEVLGYERAASGAGWLAIRWPGAELSDDDLIVAPSRPHSPLSRSPSPGSASVGSTSTSRQSTGARPDEVERLLSLGARHVDIGQHDTPWIVLADPEGNEFCVMPEVLADAS